MMPLVKCSKCGFENRSDARFCKGCGHVLLAQPASRAVSTSLGVVCLACGFTTAKPGARFCLRCGEPLPATVPAAVPTDELPAPSPVSPPPAPPSESKRRGWSWGWIGVGGGIGALICVAVLGIAAVFVVPRLIGEEEPGVGWVLMTDEPSSTLVTPTVSTEPTALPSPSPLPTSTTISSVTESPTPTPTSTPTPTPLPPTETPSPEPLLAVLPEAVVAIALSDDSLEIGDLLTVTVTLTNTGEVGFGRVRCQLVGEWSIQLEEVETPGVLIPGEFEPGEMRSIVFVLRAVNPGVARIQASVTMEAVGGPPSSVGGAVSDDLEVVVSA